MSSEIAIMAMARKLVRRESQRRRNASRKKYRMGVDVTRSLLKEVSGDGCRVSGLQFRIPTPHIRHLTPGEAWKPSLPLKTSSCPRHESGGTAHRLRWCGRFLLEHAAAIQSDDAFSHAAD